jgi:hypothetical protein
VEKPILVTGAAGRVGAVGRTITEILLKQSRPVRAMVRREDGRAQALREMGAEVIAGDLIDLNSIHKGNQWMRHDVPRHVGCRFLSVNIPNHATAVVTADELIASLSRESGVPMEKNKQPSSLAPLRASALPSSTPFSITATMSLQRRARSPKPATRHHRTLHWWMAT